MGTGGSQVRQQPAQGQQNLRHLNPSANPIAPPLENKPQFRREHLQDEEKLQCLPSGYVRIHGGLKLQDNSDGYSSPLFVINLYTDEDNVDQRLTQVGHVHVKEQDVQVDPRTRIHKTEKYITCVEELKIIPVEDIIAIRYKSQFRKAKVHEERIDIGEEVHIENKGLFRGATKRTEQVEHKTTRDREDATRLITIEIEYYKYVNPDSASILRGLSKEEREKQLKTMIRIETLKFNLINNKDFDSDDFVEKQKQAELLCRAVVHLKTLRHAYPSVQALPALFHQESLETLGHVFVERNLSGSPTTTNQAQYQTIPVQKRLEIEGGQEHTTE